MCGPRFPRASPLTVKVDVYELSFTEPYLFDRRLEGGFDIYRRNYSNTDSGVHPFDETNTGGKIRFGVPLNDDTTPGRILRGLPAEDFWCRSKYSSLIANDRFISIVGTSVTYNTIDDFTFPRNGAVYAQIKQEFAGAGGECELSCVVVSITTRGRVEYYKELVEDWT